MSLYHIEKNSASEEETGSLCHYGFFVWRTDNRSMPKGAITSMNAYNYSNTCYIEFAIQAPTGDSSDFCHYTFPCVNMEQAVTIVDEYYVLVIDRYNIDNMLHEMQENA